MKTLAIISEYNPFHHGHLYQFYKAKEITGADCILVVMSGNFVQRGEPAIINKRARTDMAISTGADLVVEIPFVFSTQDANGFALGAISLLNALNSVEYLCFGCENNDPNPFFSIGRFLGNENNTYKAILKENCKKGYEFPKARAQALLEYHKKYGISKLKKISTKQFMEYLSSPNNILAIEYVKHLLKTGSGIQAVPIKRIVADYHEENIRKTISSATSIRKEMFRIFKYPSHADPKLTGNIQLAMPSSAYYIFKKELLEGRAPVSLSQYEQHILATLRMLALKNLSMIHGVNEGLENRIKKAALNSTNIDMLISQIKTRRYTLTKIKRILLHAITGLTKVDVSDFNQYGSMYVRILGFSKKGKKLLKKMKNNSQIPIITKLPTFLRKIHSEKPQYYEKMLKMINFDILSGDLYNLGYPKESERLARNDFSGKIINK